jgi:putative transposase
VSANKHSKNKGQQALSHSNTAFHQLLKPLSRHEFEAEAKKHHVGQKLRAASRWDQFIGMAMSQLSGRQSLRDIQSNLEAQRHKLYHLGANPPYIIVADKALNIAYRDRLSYLP